MFGIAYDDAWRSSPGRAMIGRPLKADKADCYRGWIGVIVDADLVWGRLIPGRDLSIVSSNLVRSEEEVWPRPSFTYQNAYPIDAHCTHINAHHRVPH